MLPIAAMEGASHILRQVNPAFCALVGKNKEDLLEKPFAETLPEGDAWLSSVNGAPPRKPPPRKPPPRKPPPRKPPPPKPPRANAISGKAAAPSPAAAIKINLKTFILFKVSEKSARIRVMNAFASIDEVLRTQIQSMPTTETSAERANGAKGARCKNSAQRAPTHALSALGDGRRAFAAAGMS